MLRGPIDAVEEALLRYEGRGAFDRKREAASKLPLKRTARPRPIVRRRSSSAQLDLFRAMDLSRTRA